MGDSDPAGRRRAAESGGAGGWAPADWSWPGWWRGGGGPLWVAHLAGATASRPSTVCKAGGDSVGRARSPPRRRRSGCGPTHCTQRGFPPKICLFLFALHQSPTCTVRVRIFDSLWFLSIVLATTDRQISGCPYSEWWRGARAEDAPPPRSARRHTNSSSTRPPPPLAPSARSTAPGRLPSATPVDPASTAQPVWAPLWPLGGALTSPPAPHPCVTDLLARHRPTVACGTGRLTVLPRPVAAGGGPGWLAPAGAG